MRYGAILNERRSTEVYYHVTSVENVPSILKHGLVPNKANDGAGRYEDSRFYTLKGVYAAKDALLLHQIAGSLNDDFVIVILSISPPSTLPDEDVLEVLMSNVFEQICRSYPMRPETIDTYRELDWSNELDDTQKEELEGFWDAVGKEFHRQAGRGNPHITFDKELIDDLIWEWRISHLESYQEGEHDSLGWMDTKDKLVRKYRGVEGGNFKKGRSVRVEGPVTFRGRNRILAIVDGPGPSDVVYGKVPEESFEIIHRVFL